MQPVLDRLRALLKAHPAPIFRVRVLTVPQLERAPEDDRAPWGEGGDESGEDEWYVN